MRRKRNRRLHQRHKKPRVAPGWARLAQRLGLDLPPAKIQAVYDMVLARSRRDETLGVDEAAEAIGITEREASLILNAVADPV